MSLQVKYTVKIIKNLSFFEFKNWRLPNIQELGQNIKFNAIMPKK